MELEEKKTLEVVMPSVKENFSQWNHQYKWRPDGEDWSKGWGTSAIQWYSYLYPRLHSFLPVERIVEIAPGFGRWTQYLQNYCDHLIGIDLAPKCIDACLQKFQPNNSLEFYVTDGKTLTNVQDKSADLVFSFDSLVHVEKDVIEAYLSEVKRVLRPSGVAFLHHSNMAEYKGISDLIRRDNNLRKELKESGVFDTGWRGITVSAELVESLAGSMGLSCVSQELLNWGNRNPAWLNDAISLIVHTGSKWDRPNKIWRNDAYMDFVAHHKTMGKHYAAYSFAD